MVLQCLGDLDVYMKAGALSRRKIKYWGHFKHAKNAFQ